MQACNNFLNYKNSRLRDCSTCTESEIPRLLFRMPRFRDWADIFRDASFSIDHSIPLRLNGDNSFLAGDCANWGLDISNTSRRYKVGKWGHDQVPQLYKFPTFSKDLYHWATFPPWNRWECDDFNHVDGYNVLSGDFWKIYVR